MDPAEYVVTKIIGCKSSNEPLDDLYYKILPNPEYPEEFVEGYSFSFARTAFSATRDALVTSLRWTIIATHGMYKYYPNNLLETVTNLSEENKSKIITASDNIWIKYEEFYKKSLILWNILDPENKKTGSFDYPFTLIQYVWATPPEVFIDKTITIDHSQYPLRLNENPVMVKQIYEEYIAALSDFFFAIKQYFKVTTNSDFDFFDYQ